MATKKSAWKKESLLGTVKHIGSKKKPAPTENIREMFLIYMLTILIVFIAGMWVWQTLLCDHHGKMHKYGSGYDKRVK